MKTIKYSIVIIIAMVMISCDKKTEDLKVEVYETSASGNKLKKVTEFTKVGDNVVTLKIVPEEKFQTITGFGGAFTESSAYLLNQMGK